VNDGQRKADMELVLKLMILGFCVGFPCFLGYTVVRAICPHIRSAWSAGLSFCVGSGLITFWIFVLGMLKAPLTIAVINWPLLALAAMLFILRRPGRVVALEHNKRVRFCKLNMLDFRIWISGAVFLTLLFVVIEAGALQTYVWDSLSYIAFNAKVIFFERSFQYNANLPHPSSPMGIPLLQFWFNLNLGYWSEYFIQAPFPIYFISLLWVVWSFLKEHVSDRAAWIGIFLLIAANLPVYHAAIGYMDVALSLCLCSSILLVFEAVEKRDDRLFGVAGLCAGLGVWTKLEGAAFVLIVAVLYAVLECGLKKERFKLRSMLKRLVFFGAIPVLVFAVQWVYKKDLGLLLFAGRFGLLGFGEAMFRLKLFVLKATESMFLPLNWNVNWLMWVAGLMLTPFYKNKLSAYLCLGILFFWAAWSGCFVLTNNFQFMNAVLSRAILQFFPLVVLMNAICFDQFVFHEQKKTKDNAG